jgi:predicted RNase H-like nuclease
VSLSSKPAALSRLLLAGEKAGSMAKTPIKGLEQCWVGVDGTRTGWVAFVWHQDGNHQLWHITKLEELKSVSSRHDVNAIGVDIPIGLLDVAQKGGRGCDREARRLLSCARRNAQQSSTRHKDATLVGPSSIFTPPCRKALLVAFEDNGLDVCCTHAQVSTANKNSVLGIDGIDNTGEGLGLSIQTFHILPKIKEADDFISAPITSTGSDSIAVTFDQAVPVLECHPELAFLALSLDEDADGIAEAKALHSKKTLQGRRQRLLLLCKVAHLDARMLLSLAGEPLPSEGDDPLERLCHLRTWRIPSLSGQYEGKVSVAADDVLDAIVCASTSKRWSSGRARAVREGTSTKLDTRRLPMLIWA